MYKVKRTVGYNRTSTSSHATKDEAVAKANEHPGAKVIDCDSGHVVLVSTKVERLRDEKGRFVRRAA